VRALQPRSTLPVASGYDADHDALFNVGFMLLNDRRTTARTRAGRSLLTTNNKAVLKSLIANLTIGGDKGSNADFAKSLYEAYLYFKGLAPYQGSCAQARHERVQQRPLHPARRRRRARATT
jgi:hypothetical protein